MASDQRRAIESRGLSHLTVPAGKIAGENKTQAALDIMRVVGSLRVGSIKFVAYSNDHHPRHVHALQGNEIEVIIDLREDRTVAIADRKNAFWPKDLRPAQIRPILKAAAETFDDLAALWEKANGKKES